MKCYVKNGFCIKLLMACVCFAFFDVNALNPYMTEWMQYVDSYSPDYSGGKEGEVYILVDGDEYGIAIGNISGLENGESFLLILDKQLPEFRTKLRSMLDKSERWTKTAKENNVPEFLKKYDLNFGPYQAVTTPSHWIGAGYWDTILDSSNFFVSNNNFQYSIELFAKCTQGDAEGKNAHLGIHFTNLTQIRELLDIIDDSNLKRHISGDSRNGTNYDSLFK